MTAEFMLRTRSDLLSMRAAMKAFSPHSGGVYKTQIIVYPTSRLEGGLMDGPIV